MVLGEPKTGRTSFAQRLVQTAALVSSQKIGDESSVSILEGVLDSKVSVDVWDFGAGIMRSPTHQFFIFPDSVFVVVFSFIDPASVRRLDYWIDLLLGKLTDVHLILVGTHSDRCPGHTEVINQLRLR